MTANQMQMLSHQDPSATKRRAVIPCSKPTCNPKLGRMETDEKNMRHVKHPCSFPLTLAIHSKVQDPKVIEMLIVADPSVPMCEAGPMREAPLLALLRRTPQRADLIVKMLLTDANCDGKVDKHQNTLLHVAVASRAPFQVIKHLSLMHPEATLKCNFHKKTPLEIAQRMSTVPFGEAAAFNDDLCNFFAIFVGRNRSMHENSSPFLRALTLACTPGPMQRDGMNLFAESFA